VLERSPGARERSQMTLSPEMLNDPAALKNSRMPERAGGALASPRHRRALSELKSNTISSRAEPVEGTETDHGRAPPLQRGGASLHTQLRLFPGSLVAAFRGSRKRPIRGRARQRGRAQGQVLAARAAEPPVRRYDWRSRRSSPSRRRASFRALPSRPHPTAASATSRGAVAADRDRLEAASPSASAGGTRWWWRSSARSRGDRGLFDRLAEKWKVGQRVSTTASSSDLPPGPEDADRGRLRPRGH